MNENFEWEGAGWYASHQEGGYEGQYIRTVRIGGEELQDPSAASREMGYGTPHWYDAKP